jgi:hypothetical protein
MHDAYACISAEKRNRSEISRFQSGAVMHVARGIWVDRWCRADFRVR